MLIVIIMVMVAIHITSVVPDCCSGITNLLITCIQKSQQTPEHHHSINVSRRVQKINKSRVQLLESWLCYQLAHFWQPLNVPASLRCAFQLTVSCHLSEAERFLVKKENSRALSLLALEKKILFGRKPNHSQV